MNDLRFTGLELQIRLRLAVVFTYGQDSRLAGHGIKENRRSERHCELYPVIPSLSRVIGYEVIVSIIDPATDKAQDGIGLDGGTPSFP